jgi:hypothetical protein
VESRATAGRRDGAHRTRCSRTDGSAGPCDRTGPGVGTRRRSGQRIARFARDAYIPATGGQRGNQPNDAGRANSARKRKLRRFDTHHVP